MNYITFLIATALTITFTNQVYSLENGLARTPPMGWLAWERFRCITDCLTYPDECISENLFKRMADAMVSGGYLKAGYEYIIIDDCWMEKERNSDGVLEADKIRFPNGIKYLADYVHSKGLKFGIYQDFGTKTCAGYPGIVGYMEIDANTFAKWGVDYVKLDGCYSDIVDMDTGYPEFGDLLNKTGRPMVYSCSWPVYQEVAGTMPNYEALKRHCNLWRNWGDIDDSWSSVTSITKYFANNQNRIQPHGGPGHWNDPDMLIIGNYGLTIDQSQAQMAIWAILAAPLLMSCDLDTIRPEFKEILLNQNIIKINQDPMGIQGRRISYKDNIEIWTRPVTSFNNKSHSYAIAFVSHRVDGAPFATNIKLVDLGLNNTRGYSVKDLYASKYVGDILYPKSIFNVRVNPSGCKFYKFIPM